MKSGDNPATLPASCGRCGKTIRMREDSDAVLCTAILDLVDASYEDVCVYYVERDEPCGPSSLDRT